MAARFASLVTIGCCVALVGVTGCGGSDSASASGTGGAGGGVGGGGGAGGSGGAAFATAKHAPLVMKEHSGGVFDSPAVVTITFSSFDKTDYVQQFGDWVVTSDYFTTAMGEYGVGPATHLAKVVLSDDPPASDADLMTILRAHMADGSLPSPADNPQAIYLVYFPKGAPFNDQGKICYAFDGYHAWDTFMGSRFVYAIIGECDGMINTASHELTEAATDPYWGWFTDGASDDPWHWVQDDELGDLCEYYDSIDVDGWPVARLWSNAAAKADENPCQPVPPNDEVFKDVDPMPAKLQKVARGQSTTFELTGWSTAPVKPWKLIMDHATYYPNQVGSFKAQAKLSKNTIQNGETVELTITVPSDAKPGALGMIGVYSDAHYAEECYVGVVAE